MQYIKAGTIRSKKGLAIPLVLLAILILFILGFSLSNSAVQHAVVANHENLSKNAYSQANAGLSQILYYLSTLNGWTNLATDTNIITDLNTFAIGTGSGNNPKAGNDPNFFYRATVSPSIDGQPFDQYTARVTVTGFAVRNGDTNQVLLRRALNANIHQQNPNSLNAAVFSEGCINSNGNPTITTDLTHNVVAFVDSNCTGSVTVSPPSNYLSLKPDSQTDREKWYFPRLRYPAVIKLAIDNMLSTWANPQPIVCGGGHYYCLGYVSPQINNGGWRLDQAVNNLAGAIYVEIPQGNDVKIGGGISSDCAAADPPDCSGPFALHTDFNTNPNILIVRGGNLEITGNVSYYGVILVPEGTVKINGSLAVTGAVFTRDGFISGGAGWSVTYDLNYVLALAPFVLKTVVIDSLREGE